MVVAFVAEEGTAYLHLAAPMEKAVWALELSVAGRAGVECIEVVQVPAEDTVALCRFVVELAGSLVAAGLAAADTWCYLSTNTNRGK